jgi:hypothetical protein
MDNDVLLLGSDTISTEDEIVCFSKILVSTYEFIASQLSVTTQKNTTVIFTAVRTSDLTCLMSTL